MQNGTACPKKGGQWEGLAIYLPGFVCTANSGSSPHVYIPSKIIQIQGHVSIRFTNTPFFNHYVQKKKHLNSTMSCFRFQKKTIQPPRGVGFPSRALPSLTNTACSATGCYGDLTRPFVKAPVDAKLRARSRAKAPVCMA